MRSLAMIAACAVAASASPAFAGPVIFFGEDVNAAGDPTEAPITNATNARNNFFLNLTGVGVETFEGIPSGTTAPIALTFPGAGTATLNGTGSVSAGNDGVGRYPVSGSQYYYAGSDNFTIDFSSAISAFGFYGTDIGDFGGHLTLTLTGSNGVTVLTVPNTLGSGGSTSGSNLYWGFYDTTNTYTSIAFGNDSGGSDNFGFDDFSIGALTQVTPISAPEPASWAMMLGGFGLLGATMRARRTALATA
jgi:hypothetical protein